VNIVTKKVKNRPPARSRYEKTHPVISFRVDKELYDRLTVVKKKEGKSAADIMRIGLGIVEVKIRSEQEIWQQAFDEGEESGIERAVAVHAVPYNCDICGEEIIVTTDEEKRAIKRYMHEHGWGHKKCHERRGRL
jgi:negative regulator of replication initiation